MSPTTEAVIGLLVISVFLILNPDWNDAGWYERERIKEMPDNLKRLGEEFLRLEQEDD